MVFARQADDFVVVKGAHPKSVFGQDTGAFALTGLGLDPQGIPFETLFLRA